MSPDIEKYRKYVDHFDIPEAQKIEMIHIVWRMMQSFVERAFGDDPVQQCLDLKAEISGQDSSAVINLDQPR